MSGLVRRFLLNAWREKLQCPDRQFKLDRRGGRRRGDLRRRRLPLASGPLRPGHCRAGAGFFCLLIALIAMVACVLVRRRTSSRPAPELAAQSSTQLLDPRFLAVGVQIGQAVGWRRVASLAAVGLWGRPGGA